VPQGEHGDDERRDVDERTEEHRQAATDREDDAEPAAQALRARCELFSPLLVRACHFLQAGDRYRAMVDRASIAIWLQS
jgi:hypothetical protein